MIDQTLVIVGPNGLRFYDQDGTRGNAFFFCYKIHLNLCYYVIIGKLKKIL